MRHDDQLGEMGLHRYRGRGLLMPNLRLLKVIVQPVFVTEDEDGELVEVPVEPTVVAARFWPTYPTTGFVQAVAQLEESLDSAPSDPPSTKQDSDRKTP